uniref:sn-1-specific diacylglycerol lipase n=1 Tax=Chromera velia CCMP2878 TaxID=1169474 RepID=A0A0G4HB15_9ALVE|eukprot:Cvel_25882.t1-p1 / transcript=Cvel_25882.t1 / gene=Cvel_25882 / organism=Chromera_velia_CCMP2878 / gene_product=Sn1-specific diacylglycerol lipase beta, putative / transcript_product=Sn1-specific diacylglycerol lipase beta, putative / location=Cvel_scaffold2988:13708-21011(-) / protein_length=986 / sequence_SO=supercontig / SO=protein_coding / is_pseudo=false
MSVNVTSSLKQQDESGACADLEMQTPRDRSRMSEISLFSAGESRMRTFAHHPRPVEGEELKQANERVEKLLKTVDMLCCDRFVCSRAPVSRDAANREQLLSAVASSLANLLSGPKVSRTDIVLGLALLSAQRRFSENLAGKSAVFLDLASDRALEEAVSRARSHRHTGKADESEGRGPSAESVGGKGGKAEERHAGGSSDRADSVGRFASRLADLMEEEELEGQLPVGLSSLALSDGGGVRETEGREEGEADPSSSSSSALADAAKEEVVGRVFFSRASLGAVRNLRFGLEMAESEVPIREMITAICYFARPMMAIYGWKGETLIAPVRGSVASVWHRTARALSAKCLTPNEAAFLRVAGVKREDLLVCNEFSEPFKPAFALAVDRKAKALLLVCRGSLESKDVLTDGLCHPHSFLKGYAHAGICAGSIWVLSQTRRIIRDQMLSLGPQGYRLVLVGHSLGAGVAVLCGMRLRKSFPDLHVFAFGCPQLLDGPQAAGCASFVTTICNGQDVVSRLSYRSVKGLRDRLVQVSTAVASEAGRRERGAGGEGVEREGRGHGDHQFHGKGAGVILPVCPPGPGSDEVGEALPDVQMREQRGEGEGEAKEGEEEKEEEGSCEDEKKKSRDPKRLAKRLLLLRAPFLSERELIERGRAQGMELPADVLTEEPFDFSMPCSTLSSSRSSSSSSSSTAQRKNGNGKTEAPCVGAAQVGGEPGESGQMDGRGGARREDAERRSAKEAGVALGTFLKEEEKEKAGGPEESPDLGGLGEGKEERGIPSQAGKASRGGKPATSGLVSVPIDELAEMVLPGSVCQITCVPPWVRSPPPPGVSSVCSCPCYGSVCAMCGGCFGAAARRGRRKGRHRRGKGGGKADYQADGPLDGKEERDGRESEACAPLASFSFSSACRPRLPEIRVTMPNREQYAEVKPGSRALFDHLPDTYFARVNELFRRVEGNCVSPMRLPPGELISRLETFFNFSLRHGTNDAGV